MPFKLKVPMLDGGIIDLLKVFTVHTGRSDTSFEVHIKLLSRDILIGFTAKNCASGVEFIEGIIIQEEENISQITEQEFETAYLPELLALKVEKILHYDVIKPTLKLVGEPLETEESVIYNEFINLLEALGLV